MAAIEVESVEDDSPAYNPEDSVHISWNKTRMLIAHFKDDRILWVKELKYNAAILFFPVHEHKEFWLLSLIGPPLDSVAGTCCITVHTKFHGILATFCPRDVSHEV